MSSAAASAAPAVAHSKIDSVQRYGQGDAQVSVVPIPILEDNYCYLILHEKSRTAALVDPADPKPIVDVLQGQYADYKLTHILTTHKHWDHAGGNLELLKQFPSLVVVGGAGEGVAGATKELKTGDTVQMAPDFSSEIFQCPCHTRGHILFKIGGLLWTGDTLFTAGCGKFFEGKASEMYQNLHKTIGAMPDDTLLFPGHEYTLSNLEFALWVEPDNAATKEKFVWATERRAGKFPTIPSTLAEERSFNPYMRVHEPSVIQRVARALGLQVSAAHAAEEKQAIEVMDALRTLKNDNVHKKK